MKPGRRPIGLFVACAAVSLVLSACSPLPALIRGPESTQSVYMPGVASSGDAVSPLQPSPVSPGAGELTSSPVPPATLPPAAPTAPALQGRVWQWTASTFKDGGELAPGDPARYTIELLPDGNALAQADCNFGTGSYRADAGRLAFGPIGATKMACEGDSLDSAFLAQLSKVESYRFDGDELVLRLQDEAGEMRLVGSAETAEPTLPPPATPEGLTPTPLPATLPPPMTPTFTPVIPTATEPPTPAVPTAAPTLAIPTATPTLAVPTATAQATLPPTVVVMEVSLPSTAWTVQSLLAGGVNRVPAPGAAPTLEFAADGAKVTGSTGCNTYRAAIYINGDQIQFLAPALMTRKGCDGAAMLQEVEYVDAILQAANYSVINGLLVLTGTNGEPVLTLSRK